MKDYYYQKLIKASSKIDGVLCSIYLTRYWWTQNGKIIQKHKQDAAKFMAESRGHIIKSQLINNKKFWRCVFDYMDYTKENPTENVILTAYTEVNGIVYNIDVTYDKGADQYLRPVFDEILEKWQIGKTLG